MPLSGLELDLSIFSGKLLILAFAGYLVILRFENGVLSRFKFMSIDPHISSLFLALNNTI